MLPQVNSITPTSSQRKWSIYFLLALNGCIEPYSPPVFDNETHLLVVDGFVNTTNNEAVILLLRSSKLAGDTVRVPELKAAVSIEDESGTTHALPEMAHGKYSKSGLILNVQLPSRLRVRTIKGEEYVSDFVTLTTTLHPNHLPPHHLTPSPINHPIIKFLYGFIRQHLIFY